MRFEIYETQNRSGPPTDWYYEWRWRLRAKNGKIIADGGEGYSSKAKVRRAINRLWDRLLVRPPVVEVDA
jgi:hypothetical protein